MTSTTETVYAQLKKLRTQSEREKITRRLPADSGLEAVGVRMREVFDTAKARTDLPLAEVPVLLTSRWYEVRVVAVAILDFKARQRGLTEADRQALYDAYMSNHHRLTAWDFVDRAAPRVVGWYLLNKSRQPLFDLASSEVTLKRRTAITAAFWIIRQGDLDDPLKLVELLADDESELVTRPVGTALREVGKIDQDQLLTFLRKHHHRMSRASARLATDRLPESLRTEFVRR